DIEADIGEGGGDHLGAAVVAVLAELHHQHARPSALGTSEAFDLALDALVAVVALVKPAVNTGDRADGRTVTREHGFESVGNLPYCRARPRGLDRQLQQVALPAPRGLRERLQALPDARLIAPRANLLQARDLLLAHFRVV